MKILRTKLNVQQQANLYRKRRIITAREDVRVNCDGQSHLMFCSNDYLGLALHPEIKKTFKEGIDRYGIGSTASSLIAGYTTAHQELENAFAEFLNRDRALFFSSGYLANLGVIQTVADRNTHIFADKLNHASLIDACRLSDAKTTRYQHNNPVHLHSQLKKSSIEQKLIVTDSVFSMDGDLAELPALVDLANNSQATLMVDDAHGIGILGKNGAGALEHFNLDQREVPILVCPLGKAFGSMGAIVAGNNDLIEGLLQFARSYIYSTASPPALACATLASLKIIQKENWRREKLLSLMKHFKKEAMQRNIVLLPSNTPNQSVIIGDAKKTIEVSAALLARGYFVSAIRPPTVPINTSRLRITLNCLHTETQLTDFLDNLSECSMALP